MATEPLNDKQSLEQIIRQTRNLLAFHRDCGLNYPLTDETQSFLQQGKAAHPVPFSAIPRIKSKPPEAVRIPPKTSTITLDDIRQELKQCHRCSQEKNVRQVIFGEGNGKPGCSLFIVCDPPGQEEEKADQPITGEARELLIKMLGAINLTLDEVFLTNIIKCAPTTSKSPNPEEFATCLPFLLRQVELIQPRIICTMGSIASRILLKTNDSLPALRGKFHDCNGIPLITTFSPTFLLKQQEMKKGAWLDLQMISKRLRGY